MLASNVMKCTRAKEWPWSAGQSATEEQHHTAHIVHIIKQLIDFCWPRRSLPSIYIPHSMTSSTLSHRESTVTMNQPNFITELQFHISRVGHSSSVKKVAVSLLSMPPCPLSFFELHHTCVFLCPMQRIINPRPSSPFSCFLSFIISLPTAAKNLNHRKLSKTGQCIPFSSQRALFKSYLHCSLIPCQTFPSPGLFNT